MPNAHGLSRHIPQAVRRAVRQRCGFGCIICGATITEYEHFDPDFAAAKEHSADGIVLLCPTHHAAVTKGIIPKGMISEFSKAPKALSDGYSRIEHPYFRGVPSLKFGGGPLIQGTPVPLQVRGQNLLEFLPPEEGSEVTRISASLCHADGRSMLEIKENEWKVIGGDWDFESVGPRYIFRLSSGEVVLSLRIEPPHFIAIERFSTVVGGIPIYVTEDVMMIDTNSFQGGVASNCSVGISIG